VKRLVGFALLCIAVGMLLMLLIHNLLIGLFLMGIFLLVGYNLFC
jgi:4-hydroxybenzoate polyprenyltransferase